VKQSLAARAIGVTAIAVIGLSACGSNSNGSSPSASSTTNASSSTGCASGSLSGQGSTFQQNIEKQWTSDFQSKCSGAQITYSGTGSSAGVQQFNNGTIDFAGSDATFKPDELTAADKRCGGTALTIPVTSGGVAVIYHLTGVSKLQLSAATLAGIFDGSITKWNDAKIAADNPGVTLPSTTIVTYHRSDGSGTTKVFTGFLMNDAASVWKLGSDKTITWPSGSQGAKGSDGVTAGVKNTNGGITYAEVSFAQQDGLPTAMVKGAAGTFQQISADSVAQSIQSGFTVTGTGDDVSGTLAYTKMTGYPISTVSYVMVCQHYSNGKGALVKDYLNYVVGPGQQSANSLGFAPLPASLVSKDQAAINSIS
jgi:phosphate transport system substrate-binding protein